MSNIILELTPREFAFFYRVIQKRSKDPDCSIENEPLLTSYMPREWEAMLIKVNQIEKSRREGRRRKTPILPPGW